MTPTDFLAGADAREIDQFRESADKAGCPCLFLLETQEHPLGEDSEKKAAEGAERMERVLRAAQRMGCSAAGFSLSGPATDKAMELAAKRLKALSTHAERLDINLLIRPAKGLTEKPESVTELIKRVGGFRLGALPDFEHAAATGDAVDCLRRLAPYAPVVLASSVAFDSKGEHKGYSLVECAEALKSVGYDGAVALDYRGNDDIEQGLRMTREAIEETLFGAEQE
ncbi:MAG: TIM barrel protein [Planctomycetota bacterium]|nr:TIM barrel protein [Planctomycetota bacterium]